ncbi:glycosyltransferase family 2 protein [Ferrovibrio sp.]|uniref:glycosyltransferase family 2 protein n=1 Tax=Ferrovibrio sp. TaxID=1917215 RepID=UPI0026089A2C|nr:glycosyltransferase family 2 protein [Ferrovibrio sp.]
MGTAPAKISVVVSTYNSPVFLEMVLRALARQRLDGGTEYEIIVADDGSGEPTRALIDRLRPEMPCPLLHAWQPDTGFRLAESRNNALLQTRGDYVVFIDGDCLVLPDFIASHARLAEPGWFVAGARCYIKQGQTRKMLQQPMAWTRPSRLAWLARALLARANRPFQLLSLPGGWRRYRHPDRWQKVQTCNLAVWRSDIHRVDGFDATYVGHGLEDSDFALRLLRAGVRRKSGRFASVVLHLWHPRPPAVRSPNVERFEALVASERHLPVIGISHLAPAEKEIA